MRNARRIREGLSKSIADVVRGTTLDAGQISRFETGAKWLREPQMLELAAYYGCSIGDLVRDADIPATEGRAEL
mgnify:CR=1 FL=1